MNRLFDRGAGLRPIAWVLGWMLMVTTIPGIETGYCKTTTGGDARLVEAGCEAGRLAAASGALANPLRQSLQASEQVLEASSKSPKPTPEPSEPPPEDPQRSSPAEPMPSDQDTSGTLGVLLPGSPSFGGSAACAIPILVPPGRCAVSPELALTYDSSRTNGWVGVGWSFDLGAIQRSTRHGLDYAADDFVATIKGAASELVRRPEWGQGYYGERIEGAFSKYYRNPSSGGWEILSREGLRYFYGSSAASRQEGPFGIFKWCLDRVEDPNGNFLTVTYRKDQGEIYPLRVDYTGNGSLAPSNRVEFTTEDRPDKTLSYPGHDKAVTAQRLKSIAVYAGSQLARRYVLAYEQGRASGRSRLLSITQYGTDGKTALPPAAFGWQEGGTGWDEGRSLNDFGFAAYPHTGLYMGWEYGVHIDFYDRYPVMTGDFNGDGRTDIGRLTCTGAIFYVRTPEGGWKKIQEIVDDRIGNCTLIEGAQWPVITGDFNGDGRTDFGRVHDGGVRIYFASAGDGWRRMPDLADFGAGAYPCWSCYPTFTGDFDGDGKTDIARAGGSGISVYRSKGDGQWAPFASIEGDLSTGQGYTDTSLYPMVIGDFNGDGRTDIGRVHSSGMRVYFSDPATGWRRMPDVSEFGRNVGYVNAGQYPVFVGDFNGDGKSDVGRVHTRGVGVLLSKGNGQWERVADIDGDLGLDQGYTGTGTHPMVLGDFNGDGGIDIGRAGDQQIRSYRFDGAKGWVALEPLVRFTKAQGYTSTMKFPILTGDFDGDGKTDIGRIGKQQTDVSLSKGPFPDLLAEMKGNLGGGAAITYAPSSRYANILLPFRVYTVSSITSDDGLGNQSTTRYTYAGGYFDAAEREFRGFGYVRRQDPDGSTHDTWYHQDRYLKGRPYCQVHRGPDDGPILAEEHYTWEKAFLDQGETTAHVRLSWKQTCSYDYESGKTHEVSTEQGHSYDKTNGHLVCTWQRATNAPTLARMWTYQNLGGWLWRLTEETLLEGRAAGKEYEWIPARRKRCGYGATGNRLWEEAWLDGGKSPRTSFGYDMYGNLTQVTDPLGRSTRTTYDTDTCSYPVKVTYPRTGTIDHVIEKGYDPRFGSLLWEKDENGRVLQYAYDPLGRLVQTAYPDGGVTWSSYGFESLPRYTATARLQDSEGNVQAEYVYVDGLGRPIQTIGFGEEGKPVIAYRHYDAMGREDLTAGPYFLEDGKPPARYPYRQTVYDERGRPLWVIGPDGEHGQIATAYTYQGLSTSVWGPDGTGKTIVKDTLGRVLQVIEQAESGCLYTRYTYNAAGDLLKVIDHEGNQTQIVYDTLGRKTTMRDPDMGAWRYAYDPNGNLAAQTDARGLTTRFGYDALNRLVLKAYSNGEPSITFTYDDTSIPNGRGRLRKAARGPLSTLYEAYDPLGRVLAVTTDLGEQQGTTRYTYDIAGRLRTLTYPDAYRVDYTYHKGTSLLAAVSGSDGREFARFTDYTAAGQIGRTAYGNRTATTRSYDPSSMRLTAILTTDPSGMPSKDIQHKTYRYTKGGNLSEILDSVQDVTLTYTYDRLDRLTAETPSTASLPPFSFSYGPTGNLLTRRCGDVTFRYAYDSVRPHAVSSLQVEQSAAGGGRILSRNPFQYDPNGNLLNGPDLTDPLAPAERQITWNADNQPVQIVHKRPSGTLTTQFVYGPEGRRVKKTVQGTPDTWYMGEHFEIRAGIQTRYIFAGAARIARMDSGGLLFFHQDHLGGTTALTNANGQVVERADYAPFGAERKASRSQIADHRYTGQEHDIETGLYNYNARLYDPSIGRFISPDSIVPDPMDPQTLNRYSYCRNNPLMYVDPSGHFPHFIVGALIGTIVAGIQSDWDFGSMLAGAFIGGISTGVYASAQGAASAALEGVIKQAALRGAAAGAVGGLASGATAGWLSAEMTGGDPLDIILSGAGIGILSGGLFGGINGHYGSRWTMSRVALHTLAGGAVANLTGLDFKEGTLLSLAAASAAYTYNKLVRYGVTWEKGGKAQPKTPNTMPFEGANNVGHATTEPGATFLSEGGPLSETVNRVPGINAVAGLHDVFQIGAQIWGGPDMRNTICWPGMLPAAAFTSIALMTDHNSIIAYNSIARIDND